jgi:tripartite ATP-independent transporter DctM subunit
MNLLLLSLGIVLLLVLRVPVAFAFLGPSLVYMLSIGQSVGMSLRLIVNATASFPLLAVPLFVLLGVLANRGGIADMLVDFALAVLGRVRGGLGYVSVGVSLGFSWMSGSAVADAAALGKVQIPAMLRNGYSMRFGLGVTGAAALIAPVMPPSIPAVIFAGLAAVSTGALFAASVVPALLMALGLCIVVFVQVRRQPDIVPVEFSMQRVLATGRRVIAPLVAPVIILGGILSGAFTPTEAAAVGAAYMLLVGFAYRTLRLRDLPGVLVETVVTTAAIMLIVASAALLGFILARERVPQLLTESIFGLTGSPTAFLVITAALMLILGTVVDATAVLVLVVPILLPISAGFGVDPIVLGVLMIVTLMIGLLTPPVGTVLYVLSSVARTKVSEVFRGSLPFIVPFLVIVVLIIAFPDAVLWLPKALGL